MTIIERRAMSGASAGAFAFATTVAQNLLLVPILLSRWGTERYGAVACSPGVYSRSSTTPPT